MSDRTPSAALVEERERTLSAVKSVLLRRADMFRSWGRKAVDSGDALQGKHHFEDATACTIVAEWLDSDGGRGAIAEELPNV